MTTMIIGNILVSMADGFWLHDSCRTSRRLLPKQGSELGLEILDSEIGGPALRHPEVPARASLHADAQAHRRVGRPAPLRGQL